MLRGQAGGQETFRRYGAEHFRELGKKGFQSFVDKHFDGDRVGAAQWLRIRAYEKMADTFAERELQRRLDNGEKIASCELPVYDYGDDTPPF